MPTLSNALAAPGPSVHAFAVTPSDSTVFSTATRALWIGGAGDVAVLMYSDSVPVTFSNVPAGTSLPLCVTQVLASGTTAQNIVGTY